MVKLFSEMEKTNIKICRLNDEQNIAFKLMWSFIDLHDALSELLLDCGTKKNKSGCDDKFFIEIFKGPITSQLQKALNGIEGNSPVIVLSKFTDRFNFVVNMSSLLLKFTRELENGALANKTDLATKLMDTETILGRLANVIAEKTENLVRNEPWSCNGKAIWEKFGVPVHEELWGNGGAIRVGAVNAGQRLNFALA